MSDTRAHARTHTHTHAHIHTHTRTHAHTHASSHVLKLGVSGERKKGDENSAEKEKTSEQLLTLSLNTTETLNGLGF